MAAATELLERDVELRVLSGLLDSARGGDGRVALVYGEAGIGKTALLMQFARQRERDARLLWGACDPLSTPRPLAPLLDIAWTQDAPLAGRIAAGAPREAIFQTAFEQLRSPAPAAIVVLEDLHWADDATLDFVRFLGRRAQRTSALLVLTWRDEGIRADHPLRSAIAELPRENVARIPLRGLSPAAVDALGARAQRATEGLHAASNGNPFFVTEVLANDAPGVPATVRDAVLARAARLPRLARDLCELAAVVPTRLDLAILESAAGATFAALDDLLGSGMLSVHDGAVAFRHELARQAIEDALPPLRRRELHARVFAALRTRGEDPAQLARLVHHAAGAGDSASVLRLAPAAAKYASRLGAHREAEAHLSLALRHAADLDPKRRARLLAAHSYECYLTDRMDDGIASCSAAHGLWAGIGDRVREARCLSSLSRMAWYVARTAEAQRYADLAIAAIEGLPPGPELAMAWLTRAGLYASANDRLAATSLAEKALELARRLGKPEVEAYALHVLAWAQIEAGGEAGWALMERSLRLSLQRGAQDAAGSTYATLGTLAVEEHRHDLAAKALGEGIAYATERDLRTRITCMYCWRARLNVERGRWAEVVDDAAHVLDNPKASALFRLAALTPLGLLRTRRGDPGAREALEEALALAKRNGEVERLVPVAAARAELAWLCGDAAAAAAEASLVIEKARDARRPWFVADLAVWIWRGGGAPPPAEECARPVALQLQGDWRGAAAEFERLGCPYESALACYESDDPEAIRSAIEALDRLEARPAAARLRRRLSQLGVRAIPRGRRAARRDHPFDLTAREQEVLEALSLGLSNGEIAARLFVSPKTVDHHVSAILGKLDVPSRGAAVAKARKNSLLEGEASPAK